MARPDERRRRPRGLNLSDVRGAGKQRPADARDCVCMFFGVFWVVAWQGMGRRVIGSLSQHTHTTKRTDVRPGLLPVQRGAVAEAGLLDALRPQVPDGRQRVAGEGVGGLFWGVCFLKVVVLVVFVLSFGVHGWMHAYTYTYTYTNPLLPSPSLPPSPPSHLLVSARAQHLQHVRHRLQPPRLGDIPTSLPRPLLLTPLTSLTPHPLKPPRDLEQVTQRGRQGVAAVVVVGVGGREKAGRCHSNGLGWDPCFDRRIYAA